MKANDIHYHNTNTQCAMGTLRVSMHINMPIAVNRPARGHVYMPIASRELKIVGVILSCIKYRQLAELALGKTHSIL